MSADITSRKELTHLLARVLSHLDGELQEDGAVLYDDINEVYQLLSNDTPVTGESE